VEGDDSDVESPPHSNVVAIREGFDDDDRERESIDDARIAFRKSLAIAQQTTNKREATPSRLFKKREPSTVMSSKPGRFSTYDQ
jgi:hypothetical protein